MVNLLPSDSYSSASSSLLDATDEVQAMQQSSMNNGGNRNDGTLASITTSTRTNRTTTLRGEEQQQQQRQQRQQQLSDTLESLAAMTNLCDPSVMDDDAFNASLDELLRDANCYDALATTTTTTNLNVGTTTRGVGIGVVDNNNAYDPITAMMTGGTGGGGRKRKWISSSGISFSAGVGPVEGVKPDSSVSIPKPPLHNIDISRQYHHGQQHGGGETSQFAEPRSGTAPLISADTFTLPNHDAIEAPSQMVRRASLPVVSTSLTTTLPLSTPIYSLTTDKPSSSSVQHSKSLTCLMSNQQQQQQQQRSWEGGPTIRGQSAINFSTTTNSTFSPPLLPPSLNNNALSMLNDTWQTTQGVRNVIPGPLLQCGGGVVNNTFFPEQQFYQTTVGGPTANTTPIIPQSCQSLSNSCYSGIEPSMMNGTPLPPPQPQQQLHHQRSLCSEIDEPVSRKSRQSERNRREQERSHKITERITELRNVLSEAGVNFKPDRYSTLVSVANYVKALQIRSANLDEEHKRLLDSVVEKTIDGVGPDVKQQQTRDLDDTMATAAATTTTTSTNTSCVSLNCDDELLKFVHGIDYRKIFINSAIALAIASVDGRFVDCNDEFLHLTNYTREELLGSGPRRKSVLPHPQDSSLLPSEYSTNIMMSTTVKKTGIHNRSSNTPAVNVSSTTVTTSELKDATTTKKMNSKDSRFIVVGDLEGDTIRPPPEIRVRKHQHLSLFNLLGGEDMETVYAAMSRMLRAPEELSHVAKSSFDPIESSGTDSGGGGASSSADDSITKSDFTMSESSFGMAVSNGEGAGGAADENMIDISMKNTTGDHWTGRVKHTRRMDHVVSVNSSLYLSTAFEQGMFTQICTSMFSLYSFS
jgi:PAS domain-containing protein